MSTESSRSSSARYRLNSNALKFFGMAKVFKNQNRMVTGMDIDNTGKYLVTTSTDHCIRLYDCLERKDCINRIRKTIECKKYSASCVQFTHHSKSVLLANIGDPKKSHHHNVIRYLSLHDNAYIRTFQGHTDRITEISMSHLDDSFMSASIDRTVRLWDLRQSGAIAICKVTGRPTMAQDPEGLVFAIGTGSNELKLYDRRKYEHGPFETINTLPRCNYEWCNIKFSPDGKFILISTRTNLTMLVDSFKGNLIAQFTEYKNMSNDDIVASFTPNGKYIVIADHDVHFWSKERVLENCNKNRPNAEVAVWKGHPRTIKHFKWNPRYASAVTAAQHISMWLPPPNSNLLRASRSSLRTRSSKHSHNNNHNKKSY